MNKQKLLVLKGLPASGKSTYAKELVADGWKRVNKDELRAMIDNSRWSKENEKHIKHVEALLVNNYLSCGYNVVVDDTNFAYEDYWKTTCQSFYLDFEVKFFDIPLMECIERDSKRGEKSVGSKVIMRMYEQYLKPEAPVWDINKQNCYIFDIDGTLAKMNGRSPYDYSKVHTDIPNHQITMINRILANTGLPIIIVSGRTDDCETETRDWLINNNVIFDKLLMRKKGDVRNDAIVKREIYENELKDKYNILAVFDDRDRVVAMWRSLGLTCLQVDYGTF